MPAVLEWLLDYVEAINDVVGLPRKRLSRPDDVAGRVHMARLTIRIHEDQLASPLIRRFGLARVRVHPVYETRFQTLGFQNVVVQLAALQLLTAAWVVKTLTVIAL